MFFHVSLTWLLGPFFLLCLFVLWALKKLHFDHKDCLLPKRLDEKLVVVTGCNRGIGLEAVGELARRGARVIMACRDMDKCRAARENLLKRFGVHTSGKSASEDCPSFLTPIGESQLVCEQLDLASYGSIRAFAQRILQREHALDILINNAGVHLAEPKFDEQDGIEFQMKVNYLGHFLLTELLFPLLAVAGDARVILLTSMLHRFAELNMTDICRPVVGSCYGTSKLANVIYARELSRRWANSDITVVSVNPGIVKTEIYHSRFRHWVVHSLLPSYIVKTPLQGCQTIVYCALTDDLVPGACYTDCRVCRVNPQALKIEVGEFLWETSERLIKQWKVKSQ
ncbi:unnamed protein product [Calicophoron daubneyi]|uniref:Retinol dehydrogenase 12 n=1 Tax=Calicophoron daubneyi TaxID=300641 RepID=A0AAV2T9I7_CALDB